MVHTSAEILASVKRNQTVASTTFRFTDDDLLAMVDEEIENTIIPMILRLHSDRLTYSDVVALVANQSTYDFPYRAISSQLKNLVIQDDLTAPTYKRALSYYEYNEGVLNTQTGEPKGFYIKGDEIVLVPGVGSSTTQFLTFSYAIAHPKMVDSAEVAVISSIDYATGEVTLVNNAPTDFTTSSYYDFIIANDRSKARLKSYDKQVTTIVAATMTFPVADIPLGLVAGDRIALANETDVLLLPNECYKYLCKTVEVKIMEAQKDLKGVELIRPLLREARMAMESTLTPRITGEPRVIKNRTGLIGRRMSGFSGY